LTTSLIHFSRVLASTGFEHNGFALFAKHALSFREATPPFGPACFNSFCDRQRFFSKELASVPRLELSLSSLCERDSLFPRKQSVLLLPDCSITTDRGISLPPGFSDAFTRFGRSSRPVCLGRNGQLSPPVSLETGFPSSSNPLRIKQRPPSLGPLIFTLLLLSWRVP